MSKKQCKRIVHRHLRYAKQYEGDFLFSLQNFHLELAAAWMVMYADALV